MDPIEMLTRLKETHRWSLPAAEVPPGPVMREGTVGLWRRPVVAGLSAAALVAGAVAVTFAISGNGTDRPNDNGEVSMAGAIPWAAISAEPTATSAPTACDSSALGVTTPHPGGQAMGAFRLPLTIANTGGSDCVLHMATVSLRSHGPSGDLELGTGLDADVRTLASGASIDVMATFPTSCGGDGGSQISTLIAVVGGRAFQLRGARIPQSAVCPGVQLASEDPTEGSDDQAATLPDGLTVSMQLPKESSGAVLRYTVTITNDGRSTALLSPCPAFTQTGSLFAIDTSRAIGQNSSRFKLNCHGNPKIAPGDSETFAMEYKVPHGDGTLKLAWVLDGGPSDAGAVIVHNS